jgi:hypothetical protein
MPLPSIVVDCMVIVLPPEIQAELGKGNTVSFFGIALGFFNLTNQARLHKSPFKDNEHLDNSAVLCITYTWYLPHLQMGNLRLKTPSIMLFRL